MPSRRIRVLVVLLSLPPVALLAWRGAVQLDLQKIPAPRWELPAKGRICWGDNDLAGARPGDPPPQPVGEMPKEALSADRAALIARYVIDKHVGVIAVQDAFLYGKGPTLVQATFPDGVRRLAWQRVSLIGQGEMGLEPFRHLLGDRRFRKIPMVLETPKGQKDGVDLDVVNLNTLRGLVT